MKSVSAIKAFRSVSPIQWNNARSMMGPTTMMQSPKGKFDETAKKPLNRRKLSIHESN